MLAEEEEQQQNDQQQWQEGEQRAFQVVGRAAVGRSFFNKLFEVVPEDRDRNGDAERGRLDLSSFCGFRGNEFHDVAHTDDHALARTGGQQAKRIRRVVVFDVTVCEFFAERCKRKLWNLLCDREICWVGCFFDADAIAEKRKDFRALEVEIDRNSEGFGFFLSGFVRDGFRFDPAGDRRVRGGIAVFDFQRAF